MGQVRIVLADDHRLVRAGLRSLLVALPGVDVVGEAANGVEAVRLVVELRPDLALLDVSMPDLNGIEAARRISKLQQRTRILLISMYADPQFLRQAMHAGAHGYLLKNAEPKQLAEAVKMVASGGEWFDASLVQSLDAIGPPREARPGGDLTPRQREVLQLIAEGHTTGRIAKKLRISVKTVETHRAHIMQRLDIHHVPGLVRYALKHGVIADDE